MHLNMLKNGRLSPLAVDITCPKTLVILSCSLLAVDSPLYVALSPSSHSLLDLILAAETCSVFPSIAIASGVGQEPRKAFASMTLGSGKYHLLDTGSLIVQWLRETNIVWLSVLLSVLGNVLGAPFA